MNNTISTMNRPTVYLHMSKFSLKLYVIRLQSLAFQRELSRNGRIP